MKFNLRNIEKNIIEKNISEISFKTLYDNNKNQHKKINDLRHAPNMPQFCSAHVRLINIYKMFHRTLSGAVKELVKNLLRELYSKILKPSSHVLIARSINFFPVLK